MKKISSYILLIVAICFLKPQFLRAQVNVQDSLALVALYNSTDGPNWTHHDRWLKTPVSKWFGVRVSGERVYQIKLEDNNLTGTLPTELGNLSALTHLYLSNNLLSGGIPSSLGNITVLKILELSNNMISGSIPVSFGNLNVLKHFLADHNQLTGNIPAELGNLSNLTALYLNNNQLSGSIPETLSNLPALYFLYLNNNQLTGNIPKELGNLTKLKQLNLSNNQLNGSIPGALGNARNLRLLDLSSNQLSGHIPLHLKLLHTLFFLYLNNNQLNGNIPSEISDMRELVRLNLSENKLSGQIPFTLSNFQRLSYIILDHNRFSGSIPPGLGKRGFQDLRLDNNRLSGSVIEFKHSIGTLSLDSNMFTFAGMLSIAKLQPNATYAPQANIPIHQNGNTLSVYTGGSYQLTLDTFKWYKNGTLVATIIGDSNFVVNEDGLYNVAVTNAVATQLTLYSDTINYSAGDNYIASKMNNHSFISVYPNPAKTNATISFNADGKYTITVSNVSGKILQTKTGVANKGRNTIQLNVSNYAGGMYLITITDEKSKKQTIRLNKE
jgi:Leucine-rich repeat (LRR) protein